MIDPNKGTQGVFQSNPLYKPSSSEKTGPTSKSQGSDVREVEPQLITPKKKGGFFNFIKNVISSLTASKSSAKVTDFVKYQPLAGKLSVEVSKFDSSSLSKSDLLSSSYSMLKRAADKTNTTNVSGFQRGNDIGSKLRAELGKHSKIEDIGKSLKKGIEDSPVAVDTKAFEKLFEHMQSIDPNTTKEEVANMISGHMDNAMSMIFGNPDDPTSTKKAAQKYPQQLCDLLAIQYKAIENSDAPDELKSDMKKHLARDVLALRSLNPELVLTLSKMPKGMERDSLLQLSKGIQSLVNNQGLSQSDLPPEMSAQNTVLKDRWANQFLSFADAILARADPKTVAKHEAVGTYMVDFVTDPPPKEMVKKTVNTDQV